MEEVVVWLRLVTPLAKAIPSRCASVNAYIQLHTVEGLDMLVCSLFCSQIDTLYSFCNLLSFM